MTGGPWVLEECVLATHALGTAVRVAGRGNATLVGTRIAGESAERPGGDGVVQSPSPPLPPPLPRACPARALTATRAPPY